MSKKNRRKPKGNFKKQETPEFQLYLDEPKRLRKQVPTLEKMINGVKNPAWLGWLRNALATALSKATPGQLERFNSIPGAKDIPALIRKRIYELGLENNQEPAKVITLKDLKPEYREAV